MAHPSGTPTRVQRLTSLLATGLVAVVTALAFGRVFVGAGSTWRLAAAGLASAAIAWALERRPLPLALLVSLAGLAGALVVLVFPATAWHGLPSLDTLRAIGNAAGEVGRQAQIQVAPTPPLQPLFMASVTAIWAAVFASHALAFRAGSPLLALVPPIALVAFADTVLEDTIRPAYGVLFLIAALVVVFADGLRRIHGWGPVWTGPGRAARTARAAGRTARPIAVSTILAAAVIPVLLPGFGSRAVIDVSSSSGGVRLNPLVSIKGALQRDDPREVFRVRTSEPSYWRLVGLDRFDGDTFRPLPSDDVVDVDAIAVSNGESIDQTFSVSEDLLFPYVPAAYPPLTARIEGYDARFDRATGAIRAGDLDEGIEAGTTYTVVSEAIQPTPEDLRAEPDAASTSSLEDLTQVPNDLPPAIEQIARQVTAGETTTYDKVIAIQEFLRDESVFSYSEDVPARDDKFTLADFLTRTRKGFCQQFAAAMAVMLRSMDIPARVAVGFTPGTFNPDTHQWVVTTDDAHAWAEVLFPSYGWLAFDPTPAVVTNPVAQSYAHPGTQGCSGGTHCPGGVSANDLGQAATDPNGLTRRLQEVQDRLDRGFLDSQGSGAGEVHRPAPLWHRASLLAGLLLVLAFASIPPVRALGRRRRLHRAAGDPRRRVLATYDVFTERAAELGYPGEPGETVEEYRRRLRREIAALDANLDRLSAITTNAAYGPVEPGADAQDAGDLATATLRSIRRTVGVGRRLTGRYRRSR